jgi:phosphoribosylformylglycinamidine synthase
VRATVLVRPKPGILDPQGQAVEGSLRHLGFAVGGARVGRVVDLEVDAVDATEARSQVERMCEQLLANPLIESYTIELEDVAAVEAP